MANLRKRLALLRNEEGQTLVFTVMIMMVLMVTILTVMDVGEAVHEKIVLQDAADSAAYSAAVWEARFMNLAAYTNRAMVAHLVTVSEMVSIVNSLKVYAKWLFNPCHNWPGSIRTLMRNAGRQLWQALKPISKMASIVISFAQDTNDLLSRVQLQQLEMTKVLVHAEIERMARFNDPRADVQRITKAGIRTRNTLLQENFFALTGSPGNPKLYRHIESSHGVPHYHDNPHLRTSPVPLTDNPAGNGWRTMQPNGPNVVNTGMVAGSVPKLRTIGAVRLFRQLDRFFLNGSGESRGTGVIWPLGCPPFNCIGERWFWDHNHISDNNLWAHDQWQEKFCKRKITARCDWCKRDALSFARCNLKTIQTGGNYRLGGGDRFPRPRRGSNSGDNCEHSPDNGQGPMKRFRGVPSFVQFRRDRNGGNVVLPDVFVVLSKPNRLVRKTSGFVVDDSGIGSASDIRDIAGSIQGGDTSALTNTFVAPASLWRNRIIEGMRKNHKRSPVIGVYKPTGGPGRDFFVAMARARVIYRGDQATAGDTTNNAAKVASLFNPYWNVQLYPFWGDPNDGTGDADQPASYVSPGRTVQQNIIANLGVQFARPDIQGMLGDGGFPLGNSPDGRIILR